jgi:uncharacterized hydrophobic protein (TIGR00271 family)
LPTIGVADVDRMREALLFDGAERQRKLSRFWALLLLSAVIASAGIISDSTATVIGAMIVAPLMTPILGTVLSIVAADVANLFRSLALVVTGASSVVLVSWTIGLLVDLPIIAATSSQVAGRTHPRLIDLVAALATGAVGSFALIRADVSDTLPGVAIAISLVPPLAVVGLTLESGRPHQASGALLLFLTNVAAILLSGLVVMALYRVGAVIRKGAPSSGHLSSRAATVLVGAAVIALVVPLAAASTQTTTEQLRQASVRSVADRWADERGWEIVGVDSTSTATVVVKAAGPLPIPDPQTFRAALDENGQASVDVRLELTPVERTDLPGD